MLDEYRALEYAVDARTYATDVRAVDVEGHGEPLTGILDLVDVLGRRNEERDGAGSRDEGPNFQQPSLVVVPNQVIAGLTLLPFDDADNTPAAMVVDRSRL